MCVLPATSNQLPCPPPFRLRTIWLEDGIKGFYRGCATNLLRTTPAAALTFTSFELIVRALRSMAEAKGEADLLTLVTDKEQDSVTQKGK